MGYVGIINDGVIAGRSLAVFILENEGSIEENELWEDTQCQKSWESWTVWNLCLSSCLCHRVPWQGWFKAFKLQFLIICFSFSDVWKLQGWIRDSHWLKLLQLKELGTRPWRNKLFYSAKSWQVYKVSNQVIYTCFPNVIFISCHNISSSERCIMKHK